MASICASPNGSSHTQRGEHQSICRRTWMPGCARFRTRRRVDGRGADRTSKDHVWGELIDRGFDGPPLRAPRVVTNAQRQSIASWSALQSRRSRWTSPAGSTPSSTPGYPGGAGEDPHLLLHFPPTLDHAPARLLIAPQARDGYVSQGPRSQEMVRRSRSAQHRSSFA